MATCLFLIKLNHSTMSSSMKESSSPSNKHTHRSCYTHTLPPTSLSRPRQRSSHLLHICGASSPARRPPSPIWSDYRRSPAALLKCLLLECSRAFSTQETHTGTVTIITNADPAFIYSRSQRWGRFMHLGDLCLGVWPGSVLLAIQRT